MFAFSVHTYDDDDEDVQPMLSFTSPTVSMMFVPDCTLPDSLTPKDVGAKEGKVTFSTYDGLAQIAWNEKHITIELSSYGCDKGALVIKVLNTNDRLEKALLKWLVYNSQGVAEAQPKMPKQETSKTQ